MNWDYSPDANGSYELNYANNAAAICFSFERDADGNAGELHEDAGLSRSARLHWSPIRNGRARLRRKLPGIPDQRGPRPRRELDEDDPLLYADLLMDGVNTDALVSTSTTMAR